MKDINSTFVNVTWEPSRSGNPGSVFYVQYRARGGYHWLRSPDEYMDHYMEIADLDPGTVYQVRVVAVNGDDMESPSPWQEFRTAGVGRCHTPTTEDNSFDVLLLTLCLFQLPVATT